MSEVTSEDIFNAMRPAHPLNSRVAYQIVDRFADTTRDEASGPKGYLALEYARSLGGMATTLGFTVENPPSNDGPLDLAAWHVLGREISLD